MDYDEQIRLLKQREYLVVKSNELVQKSRHELSTMEQKTVAYICSKIKPSESGKEYQLDYDFNIRDYCRVCGIDYDNGKNYANIKAMLKHLSDRSMWLTLPDESETLVRWLSKVTVNKKSGLVKVKLDEDLVPYLFDLKQKFIQYKLLAILGMKSAYSIRIYELLKSYQIQHSKTFDLDELKHLLMVENVASYKRFPDFRRYVLDIAKREINKLSDISVDYEPIKRGNKVVKVKFTIVKKDTMQQAGAEMDVREILNSNGDKIS